MRTAEVATALESLSRRRPVFWSEADLQHELAWELRKLDARVAIRLERAFQGPSGYIHVDMCARWDRDLWAVELKYRKAPLQVEVGGELFVLNDQGAEDSARYDFLKEIQRLEWLRAHSGVTGGIAILVTNSPRFWQPAPNRQLNDLEFRLHDGRQVKGTLRWNRNAATGSIKGREEPIALDGRYDLTWREYASLDVEKNGRFRFLAVAVE